MRALLLHLLPKVLLSRTTGFLAGLPLPKALRSPFYRWFAGRYGAALDEVEQPLSSYRSLQEFFQRRLKPGSRPIAQADIVWPCDGRIVTSGPLRGLLLPQVKGQDYELADLLGDDELAARLESGSQATVYLAPGDYHCVHSAFTGRVEAVVEIPGTLFPVNPPAVHCIKRLFARNARHVVQLTLDDGRPAALVLVGAFNVGGTRMLVSAGDQIKAGDVVGAFGFGSTVVAVVGAGGQAAFPELPAEEAVRMGCRAMSSEAGKVAD